MVTFKPVGRLGNFLFEAASALSYGWENGVQISIPAETRDTKWHPVYLPHLVNPKFNPALPVVEVTEKDFGWQKREFQPQWEDRNNIFLNGYWQTEKYFAGMRSKIIRAFGYPWVRLPGYVSVHIRRGDYLTVKRGEMHKHPPISVEWYLEQMAKFPHSKFAFFSDDIDWCQAQFGSRKDCFFGELVVRGNSAEEFKVFFRNHTAEENDLVSMSCCEHHICSASTFSWWAAWLDQNPKKRVIMPKHWINPAWDPNMNQSDIVPKEWERA